MSQLSIVIITKNESAKIKQGIESVLAATAHLTDVDILLVDSLSIDETLTIAQSYPIRIVQLDPKYLLTPSAGRYIGMQQTQGQFIYFLDGDMHLDANWFKEALPKIEANPNLAAIAGKCHEITFNEAGEKVSENIDRFDVGEEIHTVKHLGQSVLYRRSTLEAVGGFNPYLSNEEELEVGLRISAAGYLLQRIPVPMTVHYTQFYSLENPSGVTWREMQRDWRLGRYVALGQVLYLLNKNAHKNVFLALYQKDLVFTLLYILGFLSIIYAALSSELLIFSLWLIGMSSVFLLRAIYKKDFFDTVLYFSDYALCAYGFIRGWFKKIPPTKQYSPILTWVKSQANS